MKNTDYNTLAKRASITGVAEVWHDTLSVNPNGITVDSVRVSDILMPPVQASIQSGLLVEKFAEIASSDPSSLPTIKIGMTNQKMYAMNNLNVIQGLQKGRSPH